MAAVLRFMAAVLLFMAAVPFMGAVLTFSGPQRAGEKATFRVRGADRDATALGVGEYMALHTPLPFGFLGPEGMTEKVPSRSVPWSYARAARCSVPSYVEGLLRYS
eukprot:3582805-Rhodomonas_salina.1